MLSISGVVRNVLHRCQGETYSAFRYRSGMEEVHERLQWARRKAGYEDATAAARARGFNENTFRSHENGARGLTRKMAEKYGRAFRVGAGWLLTGEGEASRPGLTLAGYVGADARPDAVAFLDGQGELAHDLPLPPNVKERTMALLVQGDSMRSVAKDGWYVCYDDDDVRSPPTDDLIGELCICWLADGRGLLKELARGSAPGRFHLESMNAPPLYDQAVVKAALVTAIIPKGRRPVGDDLAPLAS